MGSRFDPRVTLTAPITKVAAPQPAADALVAAVRELRRFFPRPSKCRARWGQVTPGLHQDLIRVQRGSVVVHPVLGLPKVPDEVLEAAVFLGLLIHHAETAQRKLREHVCDVPELAEWLERQMGLHPSSEFLAKMLERFPEWAAKL